MTIKNEYKIEVECDIPGCGLAIIVKAADMGLAVKELEDTGWRIFHERRENPGKGAYDLHNALHICPECLKEVGPRWCTDRVDLT